MSCRGPGAEWEGHFHERGASSGEGKRSVRAWRTILPTAQEPIVPIGFERGGTHEIFGRCAPATPAATA